MTIKEMAEVAGVSTETVSRKVKEMYPDRVKNGKSTRLIQSEALTVMAELRKKNFVEPLQNDKVPLQNAEVAQLGAMVANLAIMMQESMKMMVSQQNQITAILSQKQPLMIEQDYYSINGYANKIGQRIAFSDALSIGRLAGKLSREKDIEIRKVDDERWGNVNSYHTSILKEVFTV